MGCKQSKLHDPTVQPTHSNVTTPESLRHEESFPTAPIRKQVSTGGFLSVRSSDRLYKLLKRAITTATLEERQVLPAVSPEAAAYRHPVDQSTPLHLAAQLIHILDRVTILTVIQELVMAHPDGVRAMDAEGNIPLHYAIAPPLAFVETVKDRSTAVRLLLQHNAARGYLHRSTVDFGRDDEEEEGQHHELCSPLYHVLRGLPDDSTLKAPPTLEYVSCILKAVTTPKGTSIVNTKSNGGDTPLALLYRRFTRQFDLAEKFFDGDNSRSEVVEHRRRYKLAAGNTWKCIELLLQEQPHAGRTLYRTVHRAVQGETPPDLLRYIVETNAAELMLVDEMGNVPLHYAAKCKPNDAFYSKYVMDELLYKHPEAAAKPDLQGHFPLKLAVMAGKHWIGGGIKSLYDAYPEALQQIPLSEYPALQKALSMEVYDDATATGEDDVIPDEQHDAIMLVQQSHVDPSEVVTCMWAHEEDAGVQMLGCVALSRLLDHHTIRQVALTAVPAVVNAMKAHPNEVIVQEKASHALGKMAVADGYVEVSFVATGAIAAIVGAMQAHVSDATVQHESCRALSLLTAQHATIVASVSGCTALLNAMAAHPDHPGVQIAAVQALVGLSSSTSLVDGAQAEPLLMHAQAQYHECQAPVRLLLERL